MEPVPFALVAALLFAQTAGQTAINLLVVTEESDSSIRSLLDDAVSIAEKDYGNGVISVRVSTVGVTRENENESFRRVCAELYRGVSVILDMTWTGWSKLRGVAADAGIIYERGDVTLTPYVQAVDDYLTMRNATDAALIFETEKELNQTLYYLIGNSIIRVVVLDEVSAATALKIRAMRPSPSYYVIYAGTSGMETLFKAAIEGGLVKRDGVWNLVFTDYNHRTSPFVSGDQTLNVTISFLTMKNDVCCRLIGESPCSCPNDFQVLPQYFKRLIGLLVSVMSEVQKSGISVEPKVVNCMEKDATAAADNATIEAFKKNLITRLNTNDTFEYVTDMSMITYRAEIELKTLSQGSVEKLGDWTRSTKIKPASGKEILPARRFFRIGTAESIPWSYPKRDPETGLPVKDEEGKDIWEGYCVDLIAKLASDMDFDYELIIPEDNAFGARQPNGKWNGLIGDLTRGETDIVVGSLTMTSEREEVVDFVAPYFEQSGILIVIRKPVRKTSLFKFMTVLRLEVWLSIVGALTVTGIMIWILDKYSPYSARNNKELYPYPCREFTLKESFWFALTSFTPQGGGEAPKALSGRTLVAAYWLFVVLMLATFTANLAAFLTVERMQSPVQSLEQLARQSRINYTVVNHTDTHQYFINMKNAEDKLYNVWKEITLNSTSDQVEYRVWDYPIKEQYGHILQAITLAEPVATAKIGIQKVIDSENAEFAIIHDSSEIKYEVTRNCNLTEVGEVFAEQPYAIAVQQGSHLQEEISKRVLDLQKDRYFEALASKYWNQSLKGLCPNSDDSEGITLESLGGVFIATLFGLALAMVTLAGEVIYYRKRNAKQRERGDGNKEKTRQQRQLPILRMKPASTISFIDKPLQGPQPRVSHISVYPRNYPSNFSFKD